MSANTRSSGATMEILDAYVIQHRASGSDHFVRFLELKQVQPGTYDESYTYTYTERDNAGEIKCRVEPAAATAQKTTAYIVTENRVPRITKVAIKGEKVLHVF